MEISSVNFYTCIQTYNHAGEAAKNGQNAQLVRVLHRNHRAECSIPARGPIAAFFATAPGYRSKNNQKIHTRNFHLIIVSPGNQTSLPEVNFLICDPVWNEGDVHGTCAVHKGCYRCTDWCTTYPIIPLWCTLVHTISFCYWCRKNLDFHNVCYLHIFLISTNW